MTNKEKARHYHRAVSQYDEKTVERMVHEDYIQHNPNVPTGRAAFVSLLPRLKAHGATIENQRIFEDGSYIVMHHVWKNAIPFGAKEMAAFHVIRFDEIGLIKEHWNVMTSMLTKNPSGRTLVDGETKIGDLSQTQENKSKIRKLFKALIETTQEDVPNLLPKFFKSDFIQHHPDVGDGLKALKKANQQYKITFSYSKQHIVLGEGNFVLSISEGTENGIHSIFYDLFRMQQELIAEHWNITQEIPKNNLANDNTMFNF